MAYVGSYSYTGKAKGITVFDVDVENGMFKERCEIEVDNSSYLAVSNDGRTLYSIADEGVVSFRIMENGALSRLNSANIKGMRGCHITTDAEDKYIFVSGYHDGKETVLNKNQLLWSYKPTSIGLSMVADMRRLLEKGAIGSTEVPRRLVSKKGGVQFGTSPSFISMISTVVCLLFLQD